MCSKDPSFFPSAYSKARRPQPGSVPRLIPAVFPAGILLRNPRATNVRINSFHPCPVPKDLVSALPGWSMLPTLFLLLLLLSISQEFHRRSDSVFQLLQDSLCCVWVLEGYQNQGLWGFTIRKLHPRICSFPNIISSQQSSGHPRNTGSDGLITAYSSGMSELGKKGQLRLFLVLPVRFLLLKSPFPCLSLYPPKNPPLHSPAACFLPLFLYPTEF